MPTHYNRYVYDHPESSASRNDRNHPYIVHWSNGQRWWVEACNLHTAYLRAKDDAKYGLPGPAVLGHITRCYQA